MSKQPIFNGCAHQMLTRQAPEMSEIAYHKAIEALAEADFEENVYAKARYETLKHSYLSVIAPDRQGAIAQVMQLPMMKNHTLKAMKLQDSFGHDMLKYHVSTGWEQILTPPEIARAIEFHALYEEKWHSLQQQCVS